MPAEGRLARFPPCLPPKRQHPPVPTHYNPLVSRTRGSGGNEGKSCKSCMRTYSRENGFVVSTINLFNPFNTTCFPLLLPHSVKEFNFSTLALSLAILALLAFGLELGSGSPGQNVRSMGQWFLSRLFVTVRDITLLCPYEVSAEQFVWRAF